MVEVTKANFEEIFPQIEESIKNSSFIALDTEFTGLSLESTNQVRLFDTLEERYKKLKDRASNFVPCQIGLSTFTKSPNENSYAVKTYVFFIRPYFCGSTDRKFMCQVSSLDFLSRYDFDFNKFIKEGIPYLNKSEELLMRKELEDDSITYYHEKFMELGPRREQDILINKRCTDLTEHAFKSKKDAKIVFPLEKYCHPYFQVSTLRRKYPSLWAYATNDSIIVEEISSDRRKILEKNMSDKEKVLNHFLGFTKVFRILKMAQKPIIGHNLLMDLMLFFHNFHNPLPRTYKEFKQEIHSIFPIVFDTRYVWLNIRKVCEIKDLPKQAALFDLYETLKNPTDAISTIFSPDIQHCNGDKYLTDKFPHESGYDSFITGWVFLKTCHLIAMKAVTNSIHIQPQSFKQHLNAVSPFQNKLNIGRSRERYIYLSGEDPLPEVSEFLFITHRNPTNHLNQNELSRIFDKYPMVEFKMNWNKTGAIIAVGGLRSYQNILRDFKNDPDFMVTKYHVLKHSFMYKPALWGTFIGSCCIVAFCVSKLYL